MNYSFFRLFFIFVAVFVAALGVQAQSNTTDASGKSGIDKEDLPKNIKESLAKSRIEREEKDYDELLKRGEEALKLGEELEKSFAQNNRFSSDDQKKLDRLEKLVKKIRKELGGDEMEEEENLSTNQNAVKMLQSKSVTLFNELKKASRHTISVVAIESSNALIKAVRFLKIGRN